MSEPAGLRNERCAACNRDSPLVPPEEQSVLSRAVPDWTLVETDGVPRLRRSFRFRRYGQALAFTQRIGELAEAEDHHPAILTEAREVTVSWWTHAIGGLHRNDFIMAAKTDVAFDTASGSEPQ